MIEEVVKALKERKQSLAFAESCTGGQLSALVTSIPGVSQIFKGGVISYAREVKELLLDVPHEDMVKYGEVSEEVAEKMALGAQKNLKSDWALSVTGIAGPGGGTEEKPVGTVCFGLAGPGFVKTQKILFDLVERSEIQKASVKQSLKLLFQELK